MKVSKEFVNRSKILTDLSTWEHVPLDAISNLQDFKYNFVNFEFIDFWIYNLWIFYSDVLNLEIFNLEFWIVKCVMKNIGICQLQQDLGGSTYPTQNEADMAEISVQFFHDHCYVVIINKCDKIPVYICLAKLPSVIMLLISQKYP